VGLGLVVWLGLGERGRRLGLPAGFGLGLFMAILLLAVNASVNSGAGLGAGLWLAVMGLVWGVAIGYAAMQLAPPAAEAAADSELVRLNRRQFLVRLGATTATITVIGGGLGAVLARRSSATTASGSRPDGPPLPNADDPVKPAPGTRPEYTPLEDHYKVFLKTEPTVIDGADYVLPISGLVDNPLTLSLADIRENYESFDQYVTLSCISGRVGTGLISTTKWTGISLQDLLADLQPHADAQYLQITSGDGFYETVNLDIIRQDRRVMLCYGWDDADLPVDHGFPLRIWIPDHFGMKQPKWITEMKVTAEDQDGYWVERGWSKTARVKTTSVIDTVAVENIVEAGSEKLVPVGGIAWAGDRQISAVEVRVDEGEWQPAQLRTPLSETTWVIWRFDWPFQQGSHLFEVRCREGDGTPQLETRSAQRPSGATGIHSFEAEGHDME